MRNALCKNHSGEIIEHNLFHMGNSKIQERKSMKIQIEDKKKIKARERLKD